jgi:hypothetical protein
MPSSSSDLTLDTKIHPSISGYHDQRKATSIAWHSFCPAYAGVRLCRPHFVVNLYPVIDPDMPVEELAHAYQINKTALVSLPVNL